MFNPMWFFSFTLPPFKGMIWKDRKSYVIILKSLSPEKIKGYIEDMSAAARLCMFAK